MHTTIQIRKKTRDRLKTFRKYRRESYDEIINRLMDNEEAIRKTNSSLSSQ